MPSSPFSELLEAAQAALEARHQEASERANRLRSLIESYLTAIRQDLATDFAVKNGLAGPKPHTAPDAARALLEAAEGLPEVVEARSAAIRVEPSPPPPPVEEIRSSPHGHSDEFSYEATPEAKALWQEVRTLDLKKMSVPLFKATAGELAARARHLQDRRENAELIPERVIKKLTAVAGERGIRGILGLARHHEGDWQSIAGKAQAERERLQANGSGLTQKLAIPAAARAMVVESARQNGRAVEGADEDEEPQWDLPKLREAAQRHPVVLLGGIPKQEKLARIQRSLGPDVEWIGTQTAGNNPVRILEGRILDGNITAIVILEGLVGHKHFEPIVGAARQTGMPLRYAGTAGTASLTKAFTEIEKALGQR